MRNLAIRSRRVSTAKLPKQLVGSLTNDYTFTRVLGTEGRSEVILKSMLEASLSACHGSCPTIENLAIQNRLVIDGVYPNSKGSLTVDVHATDDTFNYLVEMQSRREAFYPEQALLYSSANVVRQHQMSSTRHTWQRPVHNLFFVDFDFGEKNGKITTAQTNWRDKKVHVPDSSKMV